MGGQSVTSMRSRRESSSIENGALSSGMKGKGVWAGELAVVVVEGCER